MVRLRQHAPRPYTSRCYCFFSSLLCCAKQQLQKSSHTVSLGKAKEDISSVRTHDHRAATFPVICQPVARRAHPRIPSAPDELGPRVPPLTLITRWYDAKNVIKKQHTHTHKRARYLSLPAGTRSRVASEIRRTFLPNRQNRRPRDGLTVCARQAWQIAQSGCQLCWVS